MRPPPVLVLSTSALAIVLSLAITVILPAQIIGVRAHDPTALGRALDDERHGAYSDAAALYAEVLQSQPASAAALTGMEHVLPKLGRARDLDSLIRRAVAADSLDVGVLGVAMRTSAAEGHADSAEKYAVQWSARDPGDDEPYREWSEAALDAHDVAQARRALDVGRARLGDTALTIERAELMQRTGDIAGATREWAAVVHTTPQFREGTVGVLAQVSPAQRDTVRRVLTAAHTVEAQQMLGLLLLQWGDPAGGIAMVRAALPADTSSATELLQQVIDGLGSHTDRASRLAAAEGAELLAAREPPDARRATLMTAAQSYADAGDDNGARRVLAMMQRASPDSGAAPQATSRIMVRVLIAENKPAEAERVLTQLGHGIDLDLHDALARRIALAWARAGDFARASALVATDSSIEGFDLRARLSLYQGDLDGAANQFMQAGPYGATRDAAADRVSLLSLLQAVSEDSSPALGAALLTLARGDSASAVTQLAAAAPAFAPAGAAETRLMAAHVALAMHDTTHAMPLLHLADVKDAPAAAALARLDMARVDLARGSTQQASTTLAQLIIDFPESAVVPDARRLRDSLVAPQRAAP